MSPVFCAEYPKTDLPFVISKLNRLGDFGLFVTFGRVEEVPEIFEGPFKCNRRAFCVFRIDIHGKSKMVVTEVISVGKCPRNDNISGSVTLLLRKLTLKSSFCQSVVPDELQD